MEIPSSLYGVRWVNGDAQIVDPDYPTAGLVKLNNLGDIVGYKNGHGEKWSASGDTEDLPLRFVGGINDLGQIEGVSNASESLVRLELDGTVTVIAIAQQPFEFFSAYGINNSGDAIGADYDSMLRQQQALLFTDEGGLQILTPGSALAINDVGQVVGRVGQFQGHPVDEMFRFSSESGLENLGNLGPEYLIEPRGVNDSGTVVGRVVSGATGELAFIYSDEWGFIPLNDLIGDPSWTLLAADAINEAGQIVGEGRYNGVDHAFLLTPLQ